MVRFFSQTYKYITQTWAQFFDDHCPTRAAALSYTTLLSLVPLMAVSLSIAAAFPVYKQYSEKLQTVIFENFVATKADVIQQHLQSFAERAMHLSATGLMFLLFAAVLMIFTMENAMNVIWRVEKRRKGVPAFLMYWAVLTLLPIMAAVGFALSNMVLSLPGVSEVAKALENWLHIITFLPLFVIWIAFAFLYTALPNRKVYLRHTLVGSFIATLLFQLAKYGFGIYLSYFPTYELLYGALATVPIFLVWLYVSWLIILLGAVISHVVAGKNKGHG